MRALKISPLVISGLLCFAGAAAAQIPAAPTNLQAVATSSTVIRLTWSDNSNIETDYRVEARTSSGTFQEIGTIAANSEAVNVNSLTPGATYFFRVRAHNASGFSAYSNVASATTLDGTGTACVPNSSTLCLNDNRFSVRATFETGGGQSGQAQVVKLTNDTGYFWFFDADNVEAVVKVLNGCGVNNRYWFFAGGLTNVRVVLTVTDTEAGVTNSYVNPLNQAFQPIQDTSAFATCP
jgi:hypothetical protein